MKTVIMFKMGAYTVKVKTDKDGDGTYIIRLTKNGRLIGKAEAATKMEMRHLFFNYQSNVMKGLIV